MEKTHNQLSIYKDGITIETGGKSILIESNDTDLSEEEMNRRLQEAGLPPALPKMVKSNGNKIPTPPSIPRPRNTGNSKN